MDPNNIPIQITNFVNGRYQLWDNAHPNQIWTDAQKNIVNNFIINRINEVNQDNEDNILDDEEMNELYQALTDLLHELFEQAENNPANVGLFQEDDLDLFGNDDLDLFGNNDNDDNNYNDDDDDEHSPTTVTRTPRGGKKSYKKRRNTYNKRRKTNKRRKPNKRRKTLNKRRKTLNKRRK